MSQTFHRIWVWTHQGEIRMCDREPKLVDEDARWFDLEAGQIKGGIGTVCMGYGMFAELFGFSPEEGKVYEIETAACVIDKNQLKKFPSPEGSL